MDANGVGARHIRSTPVHLPDDLIYQSILPRLPFRVLLRFAVVCKAWRHLILADPAFARAQARCPSPASAVLARFHQGRFEVLTPGVAAAAVAPPDAALSFLPVAGARLRLCSATSGVLCLMVSGGAGFFVVNPATRGFRAVRYAGGGGFRACLAYDPATAHRDGFHIVVPVQEKWCLWRFWSFASAGAVRRVSAAEVRLAPYDVFLPRPLYLGGRAHWLSYRGGVAWYDARADAAGELPTPPSSLLAEEGGGGGGRWLEGKRELVAWRGRVGIVSASVDSGLAVWALSSSSPARWEMVHSRSWDEIPGVVRPSSRFLWSVVPAGMEAGAEEVLGLAVRIAHRPGTHMQQQGVDGAGDFGEEEGDVWRRQLLRYDMRTGGTTTVAELVGSEIDDDFVAVFGYHSSMATLN
ncbi:hypothetical protein QYE76_020230 [Lolium multiflorum]|uniref:F-box domain-containing protein n=1 Tax=Lolium multiflorum TaxID=4521 RepID=A0AAD8R8G7_LOLMU|nr:hypothetical protein QYE76_020230 [Lolium multiflorum]